MTGSNPSELDPAPPAADRRAGRPAGPRWRRLVAVPIAGALLFGIVFAVLPRKYTATARFIAESGNSTSARLAGLAAQFGVPIAPSEQTNSPQFYADLLQSDALLRPIADRSFDSAQLCAATSRRLQDVMRISESDSLKVRQRVVERLRDWLRPSVNQKTSVVTVEVTSRCRALSVELARTLLDALNDFNVRTRQTRARAERHFIEIRMQDAERELRGAEDQIERFLEVNREFRNSARLAFAYERLERDAKIKQGVLETLAQGYEQARVNEVRDTPAITILEEPAEPAFPDSRHLVLRALLGLFLGVLVTLAWEVARPAVSAAAARWRPVRGPPARSIGR